MGRSIPIKTILVVLLLAILSFVYYHYALSPQLVRLRDLRDQVAQAQVKLATLQEVQRLHDALVRQNESYLAWIEQLKTVTPASFNQQDHTQFLLDLQALGRATGVVFTGIGINDPSIMGGGLQRPAELKPANAVGVTMNLTAKDYATVRRFTDTLKSKFKYVMIPSSLTLSRGLLGGGYSCNLTSWIVLSPDAVMPAGAAQ
jgi:hypothetical protein